MARAQLAGHADPGAQQIDAVVLTHAHLDHCGWIPRLVKEGFRGPIYATPATIDLCGILLPDSGHLQEEDAAFYNKFKKSKHDPALPLYTLEEAQASLQYFRAGAIRRDHATLSGDFVSLRAGGTHPGIVRWLNLRCAATGSRAVCLFTGDIGRVRDQNSRARQSCAFRADGRRDGRHTGDGVDIRQPAASDNGPATGVGEPDSPHCRSAAAASIVPAFAVERTQKFLFILKEMMESGQIPHDPSLLRQPDGDQGGRNLHEAHRRIQRRDAPT